MSRLFLPVPLDGDGSGSISRYVSAGEKVKLVGVLFTGESITGNGTNFLDFNVKGPDGSTLLWNRDTNSGGDGTYTGGTVAGVHPDGTTLGEAVAFEAGAGQQMTCEAAEAFLVDAVPSGTGAAHRVTMTLILDRQRG